jgi:putative N6-adenine-specific DNA methylase
MGLEAVVKRELEDLGFTDIQSENGRVRFKGDAIGLCRANLWLRSADRVFLEVGNFHATNFDQLFEKVENLPWEEYISENAEFPVTGRSKNSQMRSVRSAQGLIKKAIVKRLQKVRKTRGKLSETGVLHPIFFHVERDQVSIALDSSGTGLHHRGYRLEGGVAPLRENLAAALVLLSRWNPEFPLMDPFCGSGTLCLEAAMIALSMAPGRNRKFASSNWKCIGHAAWQTAKEEADDKWDRKRWIEIIGSDHDETILAAARENLDRLGLGNKVRFIHRDVARLPLKGEKGWMVCNPPWGERMAEDQLVKKFYPMLGDLFRENPGWSFHFLTADETFERGFGMKAGKRRKVYNGNIQARFLQYQHPRNLKKPE